MLARSTLRFTVNGAPDCAMKIALARQPPRIAFGDAPRVPEERQLIHAAGNELVTVIEARKRPFTGLVEDVPHVLRHVGFRLRCARTRGVVFRVRERVAHVVGEIVGEPPFEFQRHAVVDRLAVEPNRVDAAQLRNRPPRLNRTRPRLRHVPDRRVVRAERPRAHVRDLSHRRRPNLVLEPAAPRLAVLDAVVVVHDGAADGASGGAGQDVARLHASGHGHRTARRSAS